MTPATHPDLIVGTETGDDAAVWRLNDDRALIATADFITPIVDDARTWGRIAAANSVSDVYAMGGRPIFALNLVAWNSEELSIAELGEVLGGAEDIGKECGFPTIGGHTIEDPVPKFGLVVIGEASQHRLLTNAALRDGDALVMTKMLGTGVIATAIKQQFAPDDVAAAAIASMSATNARASQVAMAAGATGGTDITGFGLLGHLGQMAEASGVDAIIEVEAVPVLPGVRDLVTEGVVPGGTRRNLDWMRHRVHVGDTDEGTMLILADAQTSGGLIFGADPSSATAAVATLTAGGVPAAIVGHVRRGTGRILLISTHATS